MGHPNACLVYGSFGSIRSQRSVGNWVVSGKRVVLFQPQGQEVPERDEHEPGDGRRPGSGRPPAATRPSTCRPAAAVGLGCGRHWSCGGARAQVQLDHGCVTPEYDTFKVGRGIGAVVIVRSKKTVGRWAECSRRRTTRRAVVGRPPPPATPRARRRRSTSEDVTSTAGNCDRTCLFTTARLHMPD